MRHLGTWLALLLLSSTVYAVDDAPASGLLDEIRFCGNEVTRESIIRQEMEVGEGKPYSPELIERSRQAIMNLGLFKSVETTLSQEEGRNILLVSVEERYYVLPIPRIDYRPGFLADETATNYTYGGQLRMDNLFGLNQRLKINYEEKHYVDDLKPTSDTWDITYAYPRVVGTPYSIDLKLEYDERNVEVFEEDTDILLATAFRQTSSGWFLLSRWLDKEGRSRGWRVGTGLLALTRNFEDIDGVTGYVDYDEVALLGQIGYYMVDHYPYHREGEQFTYSVSLADKLLGSDLGYFRNTFEYRRYRPVHNLNSNINTRLKLGVALGDGQAYNLGSSTSLRGLQSDTLEGNLELLGNIEYHQRFSALKQVRGVVFIDTGNVGPEADDINNRRLYTSVGVGARWRVQSFVNLTLRMDYAYNIDTGENETYLATSGSF